MQQYKLFVFDFGDVIQIDSHVWGDLFESLGFGRKNVRAFGPNSKHAVIEYSKGLIDEKEFWELVQKDIGQTFEYENLLYNSWTGIPVPGMKELIDDLKTKGYRVVCGTNNIYPFYKKIVEQNLYYQFDKVYSSYQMHIVKPDHAFFEHIAKEEKTDFKEIFFVDDKLENCKAAEELGITAHNLVNGVPALRAQLESLKVL